MKTLLQIASLLIFFCLNLISGLALAEASPSDFNVERDLIQKSIIAMNTSLGSSEAGTSLRSGSQAASEKVSLVNTATHTEIVSEYIQDKLIFKIRYDETALKKPDLLLKDLALLDIYFHSFYDSMFIKTPSLRGSILTMLHLEIRSAHALHELLTNVKAGSFAAQARWQDIQIGLLVNASLDTSVAEKLGVRSDILTEIVDELQKGLPELERKAVSYQADQKKSYEAWKKETRTLDFYEAMDEKLNHLILKNDRVGVRRLIEAYLPWTMMEPVETKAWKIWLDAIEKPNWQNTTVAWRGVDHAIDKIQRLETPQGERMGIMSTLLTKNQGSYTKRLRSLVSSREKNGDLGFFAHESRLLTVKIADQMESHSRKPIASPFISFTLNPNKARTFVGSKDSGSSEKVANGGILAVRMDSRRLVPNLTSSYQHEVELLVPLMVFPDEIVAYKEGFVATPEELTSLIDEVRRKTGVSFDINLQQPKTGSPVPSALNAQQRTEYRRNGFAFFKEMNSLSEMAPICGGIFE